MTETVVRNNSMYTDIQKNMPTKITIEIIVTP